MAVVIHEFEVEPPPAGAAPAGAAAASTAKAKPEPGAYPIESVLRRQRERAARVRAH